MIYVSNLKHNTTIWLLRNIWDYSTYFYISIDTQKNESEKVDIAKTHKGYIWKKN